MSETRNISITGREPRLSTGYGRRGQRRLSLRGVATMFNLLPPEAISLDAAAAALHSEAFYVRYNAAQMLRRRGDREARLLMQDVLTNGKAPSRASVARHLWGFSWFAAEPLIRLALQDSDARVREAAIYALCDLRELEAYRLMTDALQNEDDFVRDAAAWGLRACQDPAAVPVLEAVLLAEDPDVRVRSLEALGQNGCREALPVVRRALDDPEPDVKYAATLSLLELTGDGCLEELAEIIQKASGRGLAPILRAFFHATNYLKIDLLRSGVADLLVNALEAALRDELSEARMAAVWPLAWLRHTRTPDALRQAYLREQDSEVKAHLLRVTVSLMSEVGEELLHDGLTNSDMTVRSAAERIVQERATGKVVRYDETLTVALRG